MQEVKTRYHELGLKQGAEAVRQQLRAAFGVYSAFGVYGAEETRERTTDCDRLGWY